MRIIAVFLVLALLACAKPPEAAPTPVPQAPEPTPKAPTPESFDAASGLGEEVTAPVEIDGFRCDLETKTLTFRFRNNESSPWNLNNKQTAFPKPGEPRGIAVSVNGYTASGNQPRDLDGVLMNGPKWPLSENCGGKELLLPGEDVTCTLSPVSIK
jgi:hypothetical protein